MSQCQRASIEFRKELNKFQHLSISLFFSLQEIDQGVRAEVDDAVKKAKKDPELPVSATFDDVYYKTPNYNVRGCDAMTFHASN